MKKIAIIGAGIFGCCAALELARRGFEIVIFERADNIFTGASTINHLRHHYGFHYPRSKETVSEINSSRKNFEAEFGDSVSEFFEDFYGVSRINTKTTPENFVRFCDELNLPYEIAWPEEQFMDRRNIGICLKTPERVYDPDILKGLILQKMRGKNICLRLNHKVIGGQVAGSRKKLIFSCGNFESAEEFDIVVNATYSNFNSFNKWFGFPRKKLLYELVELLELYIPNSPRIGLTIVDGAFSSVLPRGEKGTFTLGHVDASLLKSVVSDDIDPVVMSNENTASNKEEILRRGYLDYPFLKKAQILRSLFVTRVVKANVDDTDERPTEITDYGNGMYSIFGGKVITCVDTAKKLTEKILHNN
ncbi:FAD-dependent oxidoreductase [Candidatus Pacearchaeota archaeon]|nr:FAD-dependent oxidoreductase [Candidatus Pacearchaeota archaeon]